jgi:hypothetical protein
MINAACCSGLSAAIHALHSCEHLAASSGGPSYQMIAGAAVFAALRLSWTMRVIFRSLRVGCARPFDRP